VCCHGGIFSDMLARVNLRTVQKMLYFPAVTNAGSEDYPSGVSLALQGGDIRRADTLSVEYLVVFAIHTNQLSFTVAW
jgi:hypothetical protein